MSVLSETVSLTIRDDGVAVVQVDRPEVKNALNQAVREQLAKVFRTAAADERVRTIVLTGGNSALSPARTFGSSPRPVQSTCIGATPSTCGRPLPAAPSR